MGNPNLTPVARRARKIALVRLLRRKADSFHTMVCQNEPDPLAANADPATERQMGYCGSGLEFCAMEEQWFFSFLRLYRRFLWPGGRL